MTPDITWIDTPHGSELHALDEITARLIDLGEITPGSTVRAYCGHLIEFSNERCLQPGTPPVTVALCGTCEAALVRRLTK